MKLVLDTNIIISALIRDGITRRIIFSPFIECIIPEHSLKEISKYEKLICEKAKLNNRDFKLILTIIFKKVKIIQKKEYKDKIEKAKTMIKDIEDTPFIALYLASKADGIWTNDKDFKSRKDLLIFRTKELSKIFER
mgnify:CR=1 FL=1